MKRKIGRNGKYKVVGFTACGAEVRPGPPREAARGGPRIGRWSPLLQPGEYGVNNSWNLL